MSVAVTDSDHSLLVVKISTRLKKIIRFKKKTKMRSMVAIGTTTESTRQPRRKIWCSPL